MKLGIDFGTSFSLPVTPYLDQHVLLLPGGKYGIPSVFFYSDWDGVLIGEEAERAGQGSDAKNLKREIKLELSSKFTFIADGKTFSAKEIVGHILDCVVETAMASAKEKLIDGSLEGVVISVPVAFGHNEKALIKEAAELPKSQGGPQLKVLGFIKEPVAAALSYFRSSLADKTRVLVYDLGGGTCDIAIVEADSSMREKYIVIDSDMLRIGGKNWDSKLETYITHEVEKLSGKNISNNPGYKEKVKREAIIAKHAFSERVAGGYRDKVRARIEIDGSTYQVPITREIFDEMTIDLLTKTLEKTRSVLERNDGDTISKIVCVGGSSNMPQVQEGFKRTFPSKEIQIFEPDKAIAIGASIYAQYCDGKDTFLSDIAPYSYGTDCCRDFDKDPNDMIVVNLIKKGDRLPVTNEHGFRTTVDNAKYITFNIIENSNAVDQYDYVAEHASTIMQIRLELPPNMPKGTSARLHLTLTMDGIITAVAYDKNDNKISASMQLLS